MKNYYLFLDESKINSMNKYFCLGGCIIEKELYENQIIKYIEEMKLKVFEKNDTILHETDIREANKPDYQIMRKPEKRELFWNYMKKLFSDFDIKVMAVVTEPDKCKKVYCSKFINDEYFISLQIILENYAYFLEQNNGIGSIYIESRNLVEDNKLQSHYFNLMSNGTLFLKYRALQQHITTMSFNMKSDNNIGLQIADFIPNVIKKHANNLPQRKPSIISNICGCLYDGGIKDTNRFGIKKVL